MARRLRASSPTRASHKELDEEKIPEYLSYEYIPYESTIFKNVFKLPGAHCFTYKDGKLNVERYYRIQYKIEEDKPLEYWEEADPEGVQRKRGHAPDCRRGGGVLPVLRAWTAAMW